MNVDRPNQLCGGKLFIFGEILIEMCERCIDLCEKKFAVKKIFAKGQNVMDHTQITWVLITEVLVGKAMLPFE